MLSFWPSPCLRGLPLLYVCLSVCGDRQHPVRDRLSGEAAGGRLGAVSYTLNTYTGKSGPGLINGPVRSPFFSLSLSSFLLAQSRF